MKRRNTNASPPDIKKEVVTFANTAGGTVYIGMDDDGAPVGVSDPDTVAQQPANALRDGILQDVTNVHAFPVRTGTAAPWSQWGYPLPIT